MAKCIKKQRWKNEYGKYLDDYYDFLLYEDGSLEIITDYETTYLPKFIVDKLKEMLNNAK